MKFFEGYLDAVKKDLGDRRDQAADQAADVLLSMTGSRATPVHVKRVHPDAAAALDDPSLPTGDEATSPHVADTRPVKKRLKPFMKH